MVSPRIRALAVLLVAALLVSGCVYLRLLQLKLQLGDFDRNFAVQTEDGLTLSFKHPVLRDRDVESFFNWSPATKERVGTAERWRFRWVKDRVEADGEAPPVELSIDVLFADGKLVRLHAPERFFAATMPKALALAAVKSLGGAKVDKSARRAESTIGGDALQVAAADRFLTRDGVLEALGAPVADLGTPERPEWRYRFVPASAQQRFGENGNVDVTFTFDPASGRVLLMKGRTVFGEMHFDTTKVGAGSTGTMRAGLAK